MSTESGASAPLDQRLDPDGYLRDHLQWSRPIAQQLAARAHIDLTNEHWRIIDLLRDYYARTDTAPAMRPLVKLVQTLTLRTLVQVTMVNGQLTVMYCQYLVNMLCKWTALV